MPQFNPRNISGWPYDSPVAHGITQAMVDAAPGKVLAVRLDPNSDDPIALADGVGVIATHLVDRVRTDNCLDLRALDSIGAIDDSAGLTLGATYYPDASGNGHLSELPLGKPILRFLGAATAQTPLTNPLDVSAGGGISTIASQTELLALPSASLNDGDARSEGRTTYVWHATMTPGQADGLPTLEPVDKVDPGVGVGYWVQQVPELSASFGDFKTSRTTIHTFGDAAGIVLVRFIASDANYDDRKSLLQELEFDHFTQGGNGWTQVNGGATDADGFVSIEKQFELSAGRHYRVEIFTRYNPDDATAIDWRVESQYSYNVDVVNNIRSHSRLTIVDFEIVRGDAANRQMLPLGVGVVVPHFATTVPDDGWLPVSGGTFNDVDYPELAAAIAAGNTIGTDLANGTFRLLNLNSALSDGRGRVLEGLGTQTPGELQNDATAVNGLRVNRTYVQSDWNAQQNTDVSKGSNSNPGRANDGQVLSSSQTQTRAPAISVLWMVRAKPWTHAGNVTVNVNTSTEVAPTLMVGNKWVWDRTDAVPDHLLPLNGQTIANAEGSYPDLWSVRSLSTLIASFDDTAKTITLKDYNGEGRFFRGGTTAGIEQDDATAVNGLHDNGHTHLNPTGHNEGGAGFVGVGSQFWTRYTSDTGYAQLDSTDTETRPINVSEVICIIAKPWMVTGDVTINQAATADIDDQSASGYLDVGAVREQWGTRTINSLGTITYPAPFKAGTVPNITGTNIDSGGLIRSLVANGNPGVTSASVFSVESDGSTATGTFMWRAIGLKP